MELIAKTDVVLALGTRLNPFSATRLRHRLLAGCRWVRSISILTIGLTKPESGIAVTAGRPPDRS
jgi:hypothetical protein